MNKSILIVDDNADDLEIMETNLRHAGFTNILTAKNGQEGIDTVKEEKPEIVLLDTQLPQMNGFETCQKIKGLTGAETKVIVLTGFIDAVDAGKAREMGADDYCVKTSDSEPLLRAVNSLMT